MSSASSTIKLSGLAKGKLLALRAQAKAVGMTAEAYAERLIEEGISLEQEARTTTFDELFAPIQDCFRKSGMTECQLDAIVDRARTRHHGRVSGKKA